MVELLKLSFIVNSAESEVDVSHISVTESGINGFCLNLYNSSHTRASPGVEREERPL